MGGGGGRRVVRNSKTKPRGRFDNWEIGYVRSQVGEASVKSLTFCLWQKLTA